VPLVTLSPVFAAPGIIQAQSLIAANITVGSPQFTAPALGNVVSTSGLTVGSPVLGAPTVSMSMIGFPAAVPLITASPSIGVPSISQTHAIIAANITINRPSIDAAVLVILTQTHDLTAANLATSSPIFAPTVATGIGQVAAVPLVVGSPVLGSPSISQRHVLTALHGDYGDLAVGRPYLQPPILTQLNVLGAAVNLTLASPQIGRPFLNQILDYYLSADGLVVLPTDVGVTLVPDITTDENRLMAHYFIDTQAAPADVTGQAFNSDVII